MRPGRTTPLVVAFAAGAIALELPGTLVHALILRDLPPHVTIGWAVSHDLAIALLGAVLFGLGLSRQRPSSFRPHGRRDLVAAGLLGLLFATLLELLGNVLPGALFEPRSAGPAIVAWGFFLGGPLLASVPMARRLSAA